jgi:hypothetical protein
MNIRSFSNFFSIYNKITFRAKGTTECLYKGMMNGLIFNYLNNNKDFNRMKNWDYIVAVHLHW